MAPVPGLHARAGGPPEAVPQLGIVPQPAELFGDVGGVLATVAAYTGITGIGNNVEKLVAIGDAVAASGGPPTPEQGAEMARLGAEIKKHGQIDIVLLFLAVAAMATAQYW